MQKASLASAIVAGSTGSLASTALIALCSRSETGHAAAGSNATSQWVFGERAALKNRASLPHTATGYAIHHLMSIFWALQFERFGRRDRAERLRVALEDAALTAIVAAFVDFRLMPSRFTPGFEKRLSRKALLLVYSGYAAGLGLTAFGCHRSAGPGTRPRPCGSGPR